MSKTLDVLSIGSALSDLFIRCRDIPVAADPNVEGGLAQLLPLGAKLDLDLLKHEVGGAGANTSVSFSRLGLRAAVLARVGVDEPAGHIRANLQHEGVDTEYMIVDRAHPTGQSVLVMASHGGNRTALAFRGAGADYRTSEIDEELLEKTRWVYLSSIGGNVTVLRKIFALCHIHKVKVAWNPGAGELAHRQRGLAPLLAETDILIQNREEAARLTGIPNGSVESVLGRLIFLVKEGMVVVTNGPEGAVAFDGKRIETVPGEKHRVVDTTGAGDSFASGFVAAHLHGASMDRALSFAAANAESVISHIGAQTGLLYKEALERQKILSGIHHHAVTEVTH